MFTRLLAIAIGCLMLTSVTFAAEGQKMSGPYTHENLTLYLVHGPATIKGEYVPLDEALASKKVIVNETGNVNELTIENNSDVTVYVQSGDIVKGGRQDRTIGVDIVLAPHSGKLPVASFCVEHGRWSQRGSESAALFSSADGYVAGKQMKLAANASYKGGQQQKVWDEVARSQQQLAQNVAAPTAPAAVPPAGTPPPPATGSGRSAGSQVAVAQARGANAPAVDTAIVAGTVSAQAAGAYVGDTNLTGGAGGSYELTLENKEVQGAVDKYVEKLKDAADGKDDVIGYIAVVNGKVAGSDVYGSRALFLKLWPRLLRSAATEAATEKADTAKFEPLNEDGVNAALLGAEDGTRAEKEVNKRTTVLTIESPKNVMFITRDKEADNGVLHRSILPKE